MSLTRPTHYTGHGIEPIDAIEDWGLGFALGNAVKYIARAGRKSTTFERDDLRKALWYLAYHLHGKRAADRVVDALILPPEVHMQIGSDVHTDRPEPMQIAPPAPVADPDPVVVVEAPQAQVEPVPAPQPPQPAAPPPPSPKPARRWPQGTRNRKKRGGRR
jgi:hypothetical protein